MADQVVFAPHVYICAMCGGTFTAEWTDEEARAELADKFGLTSTDGCDEVCDDCYKLIMPAE